MNVSGTELYNAILALLDNFTKEEAIHRILSFVTEEQYREIIKHLADTSKFESDIVDNTFTDTTEHTCQCNGEGKGECTCSTEEPEEVIEVDDIGIGDLVKVGKVESVNSIPRKLRNKTIGDLLYSIEDDKDYELILKIVEGLI